MRVLLDTRAVLAAVARVDELPARVRELLEDGANDAYVSAVSTWELALEAQAGKLELELAELLSELEALGFDELRVCFEHTRRAGSLPPQHADPFARLLVAQALEEGLTLVTPNPALSAYCVPIFWE
jgi:PIN domain nuclease of toxin-antitoxin system